MSKGQTIENRLYEMYSPEFSGSGYCELSEESIANGLGVHDCRITIIDYWETKN